MLLSNRTKDIGLNNAKYLINMNNLQKEFEKEDKFNDWIKNNNQIIELKNPELNMQNYINYLKLGNKRKKNLIQKLREKREQDKILENDNELPSEKLITKLNSVKKKINRKLDSIIYQNLQKQRTVYLREQIYTDKLILISKFKKLTKHVSFFETAYLGLSTNKNDHHVNFKNINLLKTKIKEITSNDSQLFKDSLEFISNKNQRFKFINQHNVFFFNSRKKKSLILEPKLKN